MALSGTTLGAAMRAAVDAVVASTPTDRTAIFNALGTAIVDHIKNNAVVAVTVTSVSGVTVGGGVSGPGSGSGSIS